MFDEAEEKGKAIAWIENRFPNADEISKKQHLVSYLTGLARGVDVARATLKCQAALQKAVSK